MKQQPTLKKGFHCIYNDSVLAKFHMIITDRKDCGKHAEVNAVNSIRRTVRLQPWNYVGSRGKCRRFPNENIAVCPKVYGIWSSESAVKGVIC